jgi:2-polyprenyl-6-methoxyphenol hydroxylase-like FAD-dependent oxidoreductase
MGLIVRLAAQQIPFEALVYVNQNGKRIAKLDATLIRNVTDGKYMALMHSALEEGLYEALAGHVEVCFGRSLTHIVSGSDAVVVTFNDGTTESFDLLIGADGVHSTACALVFSPEDQFSRYLGYTIACYPLADRYGIGRSSSCMSSRGAPSPPTARRRPTKSSRFSCTGQPSRSIYPASSGCPAYRGYLAGWAG